MGKINTFLLLSLLACSVVISAQKTCKALVIEAGGDLGAYEAGVIQGLVKSYQALNKIEEVHWDVFSGIPFQHTLYKIKTFH